MAGSRGSADRASTRAMSRRSPGPAPGRARPPDRRGVGRLAGRASRGRRPFDARGYAAPDRTPSPPRRRRPSQHRQATPAPNRRRSRPRRPPRRRPRPRPDAAPPPTPSPRRRRVPPRRSAAAQAARPREPCRGPGPGALDGDAPRGELPADRHPLAGRARAGSRVPGLARLPASSPTAPRPLDPVRRPGPGRRGQGHGRRPREARPRGLPEPSSSIVPTGGE